MKINSRGTDEADKAPQGQCPLCFVENAYSISFCVECSFPLPWSRAEMHEREPFGSCRKCQGQNAYSNLNCWACGAFLPWAYAISPLSENHAPVGQLSVMSSLPQSHHALPSWTASYSGDNKLTAIDGRNQFVDAISFLCPALGFVAYVSLLARLPKQALRAARFAFYGLFLWLPVLLLIFVRSR